MATKNYQWTAAITVESGGYVGELISIKKDGVVIFSGAVDNPPQTFALPWVTTTEEAGDETYTYTYLDSDRTDNNNSTEVEITVRDVWTTNIDSNNIMTVTVDTTLISAIRTLHGTISNVDRHLWLKRSEDGQDFPPFPLVDNASTSHTIATNVAMGTTTFVLPPENNTEKSTIWWRSTSVGHESDPIPNIFTDILHIGIRFKNILPKNYRPGATLSVDNGVWLSHNRTNKAAHILSNASAANWKEMRTADGGTGKGNPPSILRADGNVWTNQKKLGKNS